MRIMASKRNKKPDVCTFWRTLAITAGFLSILLVSTASGDCETAFAIRGRTLLYMELPSDSTQPFFRAEGLKIVRFSIADKSELIAILSDQYRYKKIDSTQKEKIQIICPVLEIVNMNGEKIAEFDMEIQRISFSPDGWHLAFISGEQYSEGQNFRPQKFGIIDLKDNQIRWILGNEHENSHEIGHDLYWSENDTIYAHNNFHEIVAIDSKTFGMDKTGFLGTMNLSPDGKYNIVNTYSERNSNSGDLIEIIDIEKNKNISPEIYQLVGESLDRTDYGNSLVVKWLGNKDSYLGINVGERAMIIDADRLLVLFDEQYGSINFDTKSWEAVPSCWLIKRNDSLTVFDQSVLSTE